MTNLESPLITKDDFLPYRAISDNINDVKRLTPYIVEAQRIDLMQLIGNHLYYDLIKFTASLSAGILSGGTYEPTPDEMQFNNLLNGLTYVVNLPDGSSVTKVYPGLIPVLVYCSYRRFVNEDGLRSTPAGFTKKSTVESVPATAKEISEKAARADTDARAFYSLCEEYIYDNRAYYAKYNVFRSYPGQCWPGQYEYPTGTINDEYVNSAPRRRLTGMRSSKNNNRLSNGFNKKER